MIHAGEDAIGNLDEDEITIQRWKETFGRMKKWIGEGIKYAMPFFMEGMTDENLQVSQQCRRALFQWISDIKTMKPWALRSKSVILLILTKKRKKKCNISNLCANILFSKYFIYYYYFNF